MNVVDFQPRSEGPICDSIRGRFLLAIDYADSERVIEPYGHGLNADGAALLRAYQRVGPNRPEDSTGWRLFRIDKIRHCRMLADRFDGRRDDFNYRDPDIPRVHCQVAAVRGT